MNEKKEQTCDDKSTFPFSSVLYRSRVSRNSRFTLTPNNRIYLFRLQQSMSLQDLNKTFAKLSSASAVSDALQCNFSFLTRYFTR